MNSISIYQEKTLEELMKTCSIVQLLEKDEENLRKQSQSIRYYHPNIDREKAEQLLRSQYNYHKIDGLFLLRNCTTSSNDFSLSIIYHNHLFHYKIQHIYDIYFSIDSGPPIAGLENLVRYYQEHTDGLVCALSQSFIEDQPLPNSSRSFGVTNIFHRACKEGNIDVIKEILAVEPPIHRPDVNLKDSYGSTALHDAAHLGYDDIVRLLIDKGSNVLSRDANGATPLHRAAAGNRPSTLLILIKEGFADYQERNYRNYWVPLHEAAFHNSSACVQILLDCGAPLRPRTDQGKIPLELAESVKADASIRILREYQIPPAKSFRLDWFHNQYTFDRFVAQSFIQSVDNGPVNGMFLVRHSSKNIQNYALTMYNDNEFFNFEIVNHDEVTFYIDDGPYFDSLEHLIDHYCRIPDGLPTTLAYSINQSGDIVQSRVQPLKIHKTHKLNSNLFSSRSSLNHPIKSDEAKIVKLKPRTTSVSLRTKAPSSLNSSMNSLNSFSSRSRASSIHENSLSASSSNLSISSPHSPIKQTVTNTNNFDINTVNVDRRNTISGNLKYHVDESHQDNHASKRSTLPMMGPEKCKTLKINLIPIDRIQQTAKLGEGEFGEVYKGFYLEDSKSIPVAIKVLKDYSYSAKQDFLREAEHMSKLNHSCICKLYGIVESSGNDMMMIIELLLLGSMFDYLLKYKHSISEYRLKLWASQIADGMEYMEYKGIVHRDLAARNILLQSTDQVKISDFGLSRSIDTDIYVQKSDSKIPVKWYAPEAISIGKFTSKSDVWSFGVTLWEMFSYADVPYGDRSGSEVYYSLKHGKRLERPVYCPIEIYQIMLQCWEWDENKRPAFYQLVRLLRNDANNHEINGSKEESYLSNDNTKDEQYKTNEDDFQSKNCIEF